MYPPPRPTRSLSCWRLFPRSRKGPRPRPAPTPLIMSVKRTPYLPCRRSLRHSRKVGPAVAYQPKVVPIPPLTLPPLQGPSAVCVLQAALQRHSPGAAVVRLEHLHRAARPSQSARSAAEQLHFSRRKLQQSETLVSRRFARGESLMLSHRPIFP